MNKRQVNFITPLNIPSFIIRTLGLVGQIAKPKLSTNSPLQDTPFHLFAQSPSHFLSIFISCNNHRSAFSKRSVSPHISPSQSMNTLITRFTRPLKRSHFQARNIIMQNHVEYGCVAFRVLVHSPTLTSCLPRRPRRRCHVRTLRLLQITLHYLLEFHFALFVLRRPPQAQPATISRSYLRANPHPNTGRKVFLLEEIHFVVLVET
ncbi:hypothetical protein V8G54_028538 [Vigna mungo]|uniref:Uncharacterized protein n=1 Tax=Vigna mungo TaxID=3915 RepID=A0AAQ3RKL9_VIGMU